jgi:CNT family concentrative nucleoside transporter
MILLMRTSGSESLAASANVYLGIFTAPLVVVPYLKTMTRSEIMALMTTGMATVAGSVLAAYVTLGADAGHLMAASLIGGALACEYDGHHSRHAYLIYLCFLEF